MSTLEYQVGPSVDPIMLRKADYENRWLIIDQYVILTYTSLDSCN